MANWGTLPDRLAQTGGRLVVLRLRDLRFVFTATLVSSLGDGMVGVVLAFAVLDLTHSATDLGIVMAARTVTMVFVMLIGGVVADRVSRRTVMIVADLMRFGGQLTIGILLLSGDATVLEIVASQVLVSAGNSFFEPAAMGLIGAVAGDHKQEANALRVMANSSTGMLGPALGGILVATVGSSYGLMADGVSYLLSALLLAQVSRTSLAAMPRDVGVSSFISDLRGGFHEVASRTWVWAMIINMALVNLLLTSWPVLAPLVCKQRYGGAPAYAALGVASAFGMLVGGTILLRYKPRFLMRAGLYFVLPSMLPLILLGLHSPIYVVVVFQFVTGIGMTVMNALWWTAMQQHVPPEAISRVSSYDWAGTLAIAPIGYALVGPLADQIGVSTTLIACGIAATVVTVGGLLVTDIRMLRSVPAAAVSDSGSEPAGP